ncbi:unnamed protein product [Rhodiola kirilowii]
MAKKKRAANEAVEVEENHAEVANGVSYDDDKKKQKKKKKRVKEGRGRRRRRIEGGADGQHSRCWIHIDNAQYCVMCVIRHLVAEIGIGFETCIYDVLIRSDSLASQIARAATIFRIDEVVVFDSKSTSADEPEFTLETTGEDSGAAFLIRVLRYLETPQYLRRALFPMHNSLRFVSSYDYMIGTSEHGLVVKSSELQIPATCRHLLISFGGLAGLEESVEEDTNLSVNCEIRQLKPFVARLLPITDSSSPTLTFAAQLP